MVVLLLICLIVQAPLPSLSVVAAPNLHYAVVVDAGSSGSRAYLYAWPDHSGDPHELLNIEPLTENHGGPIYKKVTPGLSSLQDHPQDAPSYIKPLLEFAESHVPKDKRKETPLFILATAGMRMVEKEKQEAILKHLREGIVSQFEFLFPDGNLEVITGKQEGIYQWIAINYVLGKFTHQEEPENLASVTPSSRAMANAALGPRTVGAIDMGGASMQIAMEISSVTQLESMTEYEKAQMVEINLGCKEHDTAHTYRVFVTTFLGYGANEAFARHKRDLILTQVEKRHSPLKGLSEGTRVEDPCLPSGYSTNVTEVFKKIDVPQQFAKSLEGDVTIFLQGTGKWTDCYGSLSHFTKRREKFSTCKDNSCPDAGIRVPAIPFDSSEFYGFSEFWYSTEDVLKMGGPYLLSKHKQASSAFCSTSWNETLWSFTHHHYPKADRQRLETQCFKSAWLSVALHEGLNFPSAYSHMASAPETVNGRVVHWTIGALLYRTRFIPLRAIDTRQGDKVHRGVHRPPWAFGYLYSNYVVIGCLALVFCAILIYLQRLKRYVRPSTLRKVPSLSTLSRVPSTLTAWIPSSPPPPDKDPNAVSHEGKKKVFMA